MFLAQTYFFVIVYFILFCFNWLIETWYYQDLGEAFKNKTSENTWQYTSNHKGTPFMYVCMYLSYGFSFMVNKFRVKWHVIACMTNFCKNRKSIMWNN